MGKLAAGTIDVGTLRQWQAGGRPAQLVDVRSTSEFATGHLPGAVNIPLEQVERREADLTAGKPVVLVCQAATRAKLAAEMLRDTGMNVLVLEGGTNAWLKAGHPVVRNVASRWALERQVRLIAGLLTAVGVLLAVTVSEWWLILPGFVGCGLAFAGVSGFCAMGEVLAKLPWNHAPRAPVTAPAVEEAVSCACQLPERH